MRLAYSNVTENRLNYASVLSDSKKGKCLKKLKSPYDSHSAVHDFNGCIGLVHAGNKIENSLTFE